MHPRISELIHQFQMSQHPEGGYYKEVYRSEEIVSTLDGHRNLCTSIYFLLPSEEVSKFHQIKSDELWFFHEGSPISIELLKDSTHKSVKLGVGEGFEPQALVLNHTIFGARVLEKNSYALVSCVVAPGFDFEDFKLMTRDELLSDFPQEKEIIQLLT